MNMFFRFQRIFLISLIACALPGLQGCASLAENAPHAFSGNALADTAPTWYFFDWMANAPYAPVFHVRDTESSLGPYAAQSKIITMKDLIKMHGHPCDGLVTAACAIYVGMQELYPEGVIDRTDTCCVTNNSPCYGDIAAYLTGGRIRFGTQKIDAGMGNEFILHRISTGKTVKVMLKEGVFPKDIAALEAKLREGESSAADIRKCQETEWDYARHLINHPIEQSFSVVWMDNYRWQPDSYVNIGKRGDIIKKNVMKGRR